MFYKSSLSSFTQLIVYSWKNNPFLFYSEREIPAMLDLILIVLCEFNFYGWNFFYRRGYSELYFQIYHFQGIFIFYMHLPIWKKNVFFIRVMSI